MSERFKRKPKSLELAENLASRIRELKHIKDDNKRGLAIELLKDLADHIVKLPTSTTCGVSKILDGMKENEPEVFLTAHRYLKEAASRLPKPRVPRRRS